MRRGALIAIAIAAAAAVVIAAIVLFPRTDQTAVAPSQGASTTPSASPTSSPTTAPTTTPSATATDASGRFTNAALGYSIQLPPPWRRTPCLSNAEDPRSPEMLGIDTFTSVPAVDESYGDTAAFVNTVSVRVERNPSRLTAEAWANSPRMGSSQGQRLEPATLDGRAGVRLVAAALQTETTIVAVDDLIYMVGFTAAPPTEPTASAMRAIVASFTFVPRTAAPAATARPPRSAEMVADGLAAGFANKDVAALMSLMGGCVLSGAEQAGFGSHSPERFGRILRDQFAAGTTVVVRPRPIETAPRYASGQSFSVATTWTDPGQAPMRVDLIISADGAFHYWRGMVRRQQPP